MSCCYGDVCSCPGIDALRPLSYALPYLIVIILIVLIIDYVIRKRSVKQNEIKM